MVQIIEMSHSEKMAMYMKQPKKKLAEMLISCNNALDNRGVTFHPPVSPGSFYDYFEHSFNRDRSPVPPIPYIDRKDIEDLGFNIDTTYEYQRNNLIICETDGKIIKDYYKIVYNILNHKTEIYGIGDEILFCGTIKNKSELKKIMQQLDI